MRTGDKIPISVIVATRNEEERIARCLRSLQNFDQVIVVDSRSQDNTVALAVSAGAEVIDFQWNGRYPKKRQWCLENLSLRHEWVLFVDADEVVTDRLCDEIARKGLRGAGYFIDGLYVVGDTILKRGIRNRKLCLIHKDRMEFPVVDDLDIPGMGEIEGHYQPVVKSGVKEKTIGHLRGSVLHYALEDRARWVDRHAAYAQWEDGMRRKAAYPSDPSRLRQAAKALFRVMPCKGVCYFLYVFVLRGGFLEGRANFRLSLYKALYYS